MTIKVIGDEQALRLERHENKGASSFWVIVDGDIEMVLDADAADTLRRLLNRSWLAGELGEGQRAEGRS